MSLKQKLEEAKRAKDLNARLAGIMGASATGEMESPEVIANKLMQSGRAAMAVGDFTRGFDFYKQARDVNPRDEVQGGLTQLTDEAGNPIMVQQFKSGKIQTAPGYGPPREMVLQDVGGRIMAIDKNISNSPLKEVHFMAPSNKLKLADNGDKAELVKVKNNDDDSKTYKLTKALGVKYCLEMIKQFPEWVDKFNSHKKKDDLADCFLQGMYALINKL
jgi:hypothetical protein